MTLRLVAVSMLVLCGVSVGANSAFADKGGHGRSHGNDYGSESYRSSDDYYVVYPDEGYVPRIVIKDGHRDDVRVYVSREYQKFCPPGLAKKGHDCQPPGHARAYVVGRTLPRDVQYYSLPRDVLVNLNPAPQGYQYVRVDQDILLIGEATKKVVDAITLLSAVNNR